MIREPAADGQSRRALALVAARNEEGRVGAAVRSLLDRGCIDRVVVVDDGSSDETAGEASLAGARVLRLGRNRGKGGALSAALGRLVADGDLAAEETVCFVDGDTAATAGRVGDLVEAVVAGRADMAIAVLPRPAHGGGFGLVLGLARWGVRRLTGRRLDAPLSGQRALNADTLRAVLPLERGFALEVGMDIDALRAGLRVVEVEVPMEHAVTGRDLRGFAHRARQGADIMWVLASRALRRSRSQR